MGGRGKCNGTTPRARRLPSGPAVSIRTGARGNLWVWTTSSGIADPPSATRCSCARSAAGTTAARPRRSRRPSCVRPSAPSASAISIPRSSTTSRRRGRTVRLEDGMIRRIDWPENSVTHAALPGLERDVAILLGIEPQLRWRTFSQTRARARARAEDRVRDHARRAARRHAAHEAGAGDGHRRRRGGDEARSQPLELRGSDRDRRRAARRVPRGRRPVREPVGRGRRTTSRSRRTRRPRLP